MSPRISDRASFLVVLIALSVHAGMGPALSSELPTKRVPLVNPVGEKGGGLFARLVTARGAEFDSGRAGIHMIKPIGPTEVFPSDVPEIYVVIELKQSAFDMFELIARFILEDADGKPHGTLMHTDRAHFEFSDTGGYLTMNRPKGGFPVGKYRVEIHYGEMVNDLSLLTLVRFKVEPVSGAKPATP